MPPILDRQFNWVDFFTMAIMLLVLYLFLNFAKRMLPKLDLANWIHFPASKFIDTLLLIYEPLVLLLLSAIFVLINPVFHGLILALLILFGFEPIKNYISGRIVQFDRTLGEGKKLKMQETQGIIAQKGRLGLHLRSSQGLHFVAYSRMLSEGYLLLSGEEIGGLYHLNIQPKTPDEKVDYATRLTDLLATAPYLDWSHKPEFIAGSDQDTGYNMRVSVKEESHLHDLIALIEEWDCSCKISENKN